MELELHINGVITSVNVDANESLLSLLRREGYCGTRQGCETGDCGACTVLVDGIARPACVMLAAQAGGCTVTTVEGLPSQQGLNTLQQAFVEAGAAPCGFCASGMLLSAHALLQRNNHPDASEVREALSGNLCRCGGYEKPVQAILRAAAILRGEQTEPTEPEVIRQSEQNPLAALGMDRELVPNSGTTDRLPVITSSMSANADNNFAVVGKSLPNSDASKFVTGSPAFVNDSEQRGLLYGRILTSPHAHAVIRDIDVSEASALSGVHAVLTYKDVPRIPYSSVERGLLESGPYDQYVLDYILRYAGERVALVVAESEEIAEEAIKLIQVDYEVHPAILDPRQALDQNAPRLHPEAESRGIFDATHNIAMRVRTEVGDVDQGFAEADVIVEGEYILPMTQPAPLEPHRVMTYYDEAGVLVVRTNTQTPHHVRRTLARLLDLPLRKVRVVRPEIGGGFGVKQELVLEDLCALATRTTGRPVLLSYTRAEEFASGHVRPSYIIRLKTGVKQDGKIVANQMALVTSTGAYATHPLIAPEGGVSQALSLYPSPNMRYAAEVLYTNMPPSGAFRGYSSLQETFALECHLDEVAKRVRLDALELRRRNWLRTGDELILAKAAAGRDVGPLLVESSGLAECLRVVEEKLGWHIKRGVVNNGRMRRGVGIALSMQGNPLAQSATSGAIMKLNEDGSFDVFVGAGNSEDNERALLAQIVAETLGVPLESIVIYMDDTSLTPAVLGENATSTFYLGGGAVRKAAEQMRRQILAIAGRMLSALPEALKLSEGIISAPNSNQTFTVAQVAAYSLYVENRQLMTNASWRMAQSPLSFAVVGAEVEVDTETGAIRVERLISAVDAGRLLNPMFTETRVQGALVQGMGSALSEELLYDQKGQLLTKHLGDYHVYNAVDMPPVQVYLVETIEPAGPFGAKAVSDVAMGAVAPAIANAVASATGVRLPHLPLTPERVLRALHAQAHAQSQSQAHQAVRS